MIVLLSNENLDHAKWQILDKATGSSMDWAYDVGKVPLAFGFELRDTRDGIWELHSMIVTMIYKQKKLFFSQGGYGFLLPADQIIPNCEEFMDGLKAMIAEAVALGYF